jgi:hypothetical protein
MLPKVKAVPTKPLDEYAVMKPTQPEEPPPDRFGNFIISDPKQLMDIKGSAYDMFADTLLVRCSDEGLEAATDIQGKRADQARRAHEIVPGVYHMVGTINGSPIFRQKAPTGDEPNDKELFLFRTKDHLGWLWAEDCFENLETVIWAWSPNRVDDPDIWPLSVHVPNWHKAPNPWFTVQSVSNYVLMKELDSANAPQPSADPGLQARVDELEKENNELSEALRENEDQRQAAIMRREQNVGSLSGWMNKSLPLVGAILDENWGEARRLASDYAKDNGMKKHIDRFCWTTHSENKRRRRGDE